MKLLLTSGNDRRTLTIDRSGAGVIIGRSPEVALSFPAAKLLSRKHCELRWTAEGLELRDLNSSNGTHVNGVLARTALLKSGDVVRAGDVTFRIEFEVPGPPADLRCESCGRLVSMSTLEDGHELALGDEVLCAPCTEVDKQSNRTGAIEKVLLHLSNEGFKDVHRLSPEGAATPVYRARRRVLNDVVAIKVLPIVPGLSEKKVKRFETEALAMAQIRHRNVVAVYDVKHRDELVYMVMEYVEGETLLNRIERSNRLPPLEALRVGLAITEALEAIEAAGIVHRNVKPSNVLIASEDLTPKLVDFGIAKGVRSFGPGVTDEEEALGTIRYVAPEQLRDARAADARADLYALAATLFHALTGKLPYPDRSELDLLQRVARGSLPALDVASDPLVPAPLAPVLAHALARKPGDRPANAAAMRKLLLEAAAQLPGGEALLARPAELSSATIFARKDDSHDGDEVTAVPGGLGGRFEARHLHDVVRILGAERSTGVLAIAGEAATGEIRLRGGKLVGATSGDLAPGDAALQLLALPRGTFEFRPGLDDAVTDLGTLDLESLLSHAASERAAAEAARRPT